MIIVHFSPLRFPLKAVCALIALGCGILFSAYVPSIHAMAPQQDTPVQGTSIWLFAAPSMTTQGPGATAGLSVDHNRHLFTIRTSFIGTEPYDGTWDAAVLYGRSAVLGRFYVSGSTGVAVTAGDTYNRIVGGSVKGRFEPGIGFPVEGHASLAHTRGLSIGVFAFANVNTWQPFGGVGLALRLGRL